MRKTKFRWWLPGIYAVLAIGAWLDFARLPPDGLANLGLMLMVLPITLLDLALRPADAPGDSVFVPDRFGYYGDHAVFFGVSAAILTLVWHFIGRWIDRRLSR